MSFVCVCVRKNEHMLRASRKPRSFPEVDDPFTESLNSPIFPRTSALVVYALMIAAALAISIWLIVLSIHENALTNSVENDIRIVTMLNVELAENVTEVRGRVAEAQLLLIGIEGDIDVLQGNVTSLQTRIDALNCTGIRSVNGVLDGIPDFFIIPGADGLIDVYNVSDNTIVISGAPLQALLDAQAAELVMLDALVTQVSRELDALENVTVLTVDGTPAVANNIDFVGECNATVTPDPGNNAVIIDACAITTLIEQLYQSIWVQFQESLGKLAILQANVTYIESRVTLIEGIIQNLTSFGVYTINSVPPDGVGSFALLGTPPYLDVSGVTITNNGVRTINGEAPTGDYQVLAGNGIAVTNTAPGTITIDNTVSPKKCSLFQTAMNVVTTALAGLPPVGGAFQRYFDVGFDNALTTAVPPGCADTNGVFRRFGIATPFIEIINQVCIPQGKWILGFNADIITQVFSTGPPQVFMSVVIGLGSEGPAVSEFPLTTWDAMANSGAFQKGKLNSEFTVDVTTVAPLCTNVTYYAANVESIGPTTILSRWSLTELN